MDDRTLHLAYALFIRMRCRAGNPECATYDDSTGDGTTTNSNATTGGDGGGNGLTTTTTASDVYANETRRDTKGNDTTCYRK